jgi:hypothetical protein
VEVSLQSDRVLAFDGESLLRDVSQGRTLLRCQFVFSTTAPQRLYGEQPLSGADFEDARGPTVELARIATEDDLDAIVQAAVAFVSGTVPR